ncbi:hypothetical protein FB107DRAFT_252002 [Schizophyllum commune]
MSANSHKSLMRAADSAYYNSLRNRLYGAASWSSRLRADGLITYDGGLGERNIKAMEFAHLLEVLAKEMQPVLDTLPSPPVWVHQASDTPSKPLLGLPAEGEEVGHGSPALVPPHKDAIGRAGDDSNSAGSRTSLAADWQCIARDPTLSGRMSEAARQEPRAQTTPSEVALPSEEQQREAQPLDMCGSPSGRVLRKMWRERLDDSERDSMEATNLRGRCQVARGYRALPASVEFGEIAPRMTAKSSAQLGGHMGSSGLQLQAMKGASASRIEGGFSVQEESHALKSPRGKLPQLSIPHARRRRPHSGGPAYTTVLAKTVLPEAWTRPAPSSDLSMQTIEEWGISMREQRRERRAPWSKMRQIARSQRQRLSSCGATATVELMVTAQAKAQDAAVPPAKVKGRPESPELRSSQIVSANGPERSHCVLQESAVKATYPRPARQALPNESMSTEIDVSTQEVRPTQHARRGELDGTVIKTSL